MKRFSLDTVENVVQLIGELQDHRTRASAIHRDFLKLIELEVAVFGRNRENIIHLPQEVRDKLRRFINQVDIRTAEIRYHLAEFSRLWALADQLQANGQGPQAQRTRTDANAPLGRANTSADQLVLLKQEGEAHSTKLAGVRHK